MSADLCNTYPTTINVCHVPWELMERVPVPKLWKTVFRAFQDTIILRMVKPTAQYSVEKELTVNQGLLPVHPVFKAM